jgi:hypothetical protein
MLDDADLLITAGAVRLMFRDPLVYHLYVRTHLSECTFTHTPQKKEVEEVDLGVEVYGLHEWWCKGASQLCEWIDTMGSQRRLHLGSTARCTHLEV